MRLLSTLLLLAALAGALPAKPAAGAKPKARPALTPAPAPEVPRRLRVTLKDGQALDAVLLQSDAYFLSVSNTVGTRFDLPWGEVAAVDSADMGLEVVGLRSRLDPSPAAVTHRVQPLSGGQALGKALWPGLLVHGWGHREAGANDVFVSLVGAEVFSVVVGGFGLGELLGPEKAGETKDTALALTVAGGSIFAATWLWDLAFAPGAAARFNREHGLALAPLPSGNGAVLAYKF